MSDSEKEQHRASLSVSDQNSCGTQEQDSLENDDSTEQSASEEVSESRNSQLAAEPTQESDDHNRAGEKTQSTALHRGSIKPPLIPTTTASPFSLYAVSDQSRNELHSKFRAYEARRRSIYTAKLESSSLYWRSFRDLLQASIHETSRAERIVLGTSKAYDKYAQAMQAMYEDVFLDDKGNVVQTRRAQQQLAKQRTDEEVLLTNLSSNNNKAALSNHSEDRRQSILGTLIQSQSVMAEKFRENSQHVETEISKDIATLKTEMQAKVTEIETVGNAILAELEKTENQVQQAWDAYYTTAIRGLGGGGGTTSNMTRRAGAIVIAEDDKQGGQQSGGADKGEVVESCSDVWLVEMQYRVAVNYQTATWDKGSAELSKLFTSMKDAECQRRINLREHLLTFVQRQQRLFLSLPEVHTPVLQDLVSRHMDPAAVEEQVQQAIRKRAHLLQRQEKTKDDQGSTVSPTPGHGLTGVKEEDGNFTIDSPLTSGLLCRAKVIEKKSSGMMQGWKTTLAIVTADSFLHLFDLPSSSIKPGTAPEVAFASLVPQIQVPTTGAVKSTKILSGFADHPLNPSDSLALANCSITTSIQDIKWCSFEVTEKVINKGASKVFSKTAMKSFKLRMLTRGEMEEWISVLQAQK